MPAHKTSVVLEVAFKPLVIGLERPAYLTSFDDFQRSLLSHVVMITNTRNLGADDVANLARLGETGAFVQAALTSNKFICWQQGDTDYPAAHPMLRKAVNDHGWFLILRDGGLEPVHRVVNAYLALF